MRIKHTVNEDQTHSKRGAYRDIQGRRNSTVGTVHPVQEEHCSWRRHISGDFFLVLEEHIPSLVGADTLQDEQTHFAGVADTQCRNRGHPVQEEQICSVVGKDTYRRTRHPGGADTVHEEQTPTAGGADTQLSRSRHTGKAYSAGGAETK